VAINDVATTVPISREVERKQKIQDEKVLLRNAALVTTSSCINGIYLNTGRRKKDFKIQTDNTAARIQKRVRICQAKAKLAKLKHASALLGSTNFSFQVI
jgi:predicted pyridoxine 5'-phosphate oxidase superfamily flavin-nucleotide-binding protein